MRAFETLSTLGWIATVCSFLVCACSSDDQPPAVSMGSPMSTAGAGAVGAGSGAADLTQAGAAAAKPTGANGPTGTAGSRLPTGGAVAGGSASPPAAGTGTAIAGAPAPAAGTGGAMAHGAAGTSGAAGTPAAEAPCEKGVVEASEVVFIGESFIAQTGAIPRMLSQLARDAGTIGANESYRSFAVSGTQLTTGDIPNQYTRAQNESPVKVVLMDGGGNDLLFGGRCEGSFDAPCKEVVDTVVELFAQMKMGGVKDVVYFFYPDPMGIGADIKEGMDILRPEMKKLCDETADVRCVWVDQRESWDGNYEMFTSDGIHPTEAGSMASAQQIWAAMVANCVAQ